MTPCEELGYKVGDEFECFGAHHVDDGSVVRLDEDDGSEMPFFTISKGSSQFDRPAIFLKRLSKIVEDEQITPRPGDYVSTEGMTEEQYHAVARAFMEAGCGRFPGTLNRDAAIIGWSSWFNAYGWDREACGSFTRHLTIDQVLNATNAAPQEATMTADPITTLKQARKARDEAEQAYQQALAEAREYLGEGFALTEVGSDGPLVDGENMNDPANWREGDVVVNLIDDYPAVYTKGEMYTVKSNYHGEVRIYDNFGGQSCCKISHAQASKQFRFHHRPN